MTRCGLPHSDIFGSKLVCSSPKLFAACHVLHRLLAPRHSPYTLSSLTIRNSKLTLANRCIQLACDSSMQHCLSRRSPSIALGAKADECCGRKKLPFAEYSVVKERFSAGGQAPEPPGSLPRRGPEARLRSLARESVSQRFRVASIC
jgi:hypothetical protein